MAERAVVIGSGPNGLAASITLLRAGFKVEIFEANHESGGGCRSTESTLAGFVHDHCAAVMPAAMNSRFFRSLPPNAIKWIEPPIAVAHPFEDGSAAALYRSVDETAHSLGEDADAYRRFFGPLVAAGLPLIDDLMEPIHLPAKPLESLRFARNGLRSAERVANAYFRGRDARALFAGNAAHSMLRLCAPVSAAPALVLMTLGHLCGWPIPRGGAGKVTSALIQEIERLGGIVRANHRVTDLARFGADDLIFFDTGPLAMAAIAGDNLPTRYRDRIKRFRYGPGVFKVDWALSGEIPWTAAECHETATVHLGGTFEEIARSEDDVASGRHPERPSVILAQPSLFDPSRAPARKHVGWAYCHVPSGSTVDMTEAIEQQVERFAPGFRDLILARTVTTTADFERDNANLTGGDIGSGLHDWRQLLTRPVPRISPYRTPDKRLFLCSASTPPGAGVHGLGGLYAVEAALGKSARR